MIKNFNTPICDTCLEDSYGLDSNDYHFPNWTKCRECGTTTWCFDDNEDFLDLLYQ